MSQHECDWGIATRGGSSSSKVQDVSLGHFARTEAYKRSAITYVQRLLNKHFKEKEKKEEEGEWEGDYSIL